MKIRWLGHASFLITSEEQGVRIVTDPYTPVEGRLMYRPIDEEADIVTVSHEHGDHNNVAAVTGNPEVFRGLEALGEEKTASAVINDIEFRAIASHHDNRTGGQRGSNGIICFALDGVFVCHLGDLGHLLDDETIAAIGPVDVLLCPVGGSYTINADMARDVVATIGPRVIIPMHVRNERCAFPIDDVEVFLAGRSPVRRIEGDAVFDADTLPDPTETVVLQPVK